MNITQGTIELNKEKETMTNEESDEAMEQITLDDCTDQEDFDRFTANAKSLEYVEKCFFYLNFDVDNEETYDIKSGKLLDAPYYIYELHGNDIPLYIQYVGGFYEPNGIGTILEIEGKKYKYIDSISLPQETEFQLTNGTLVYYYSGYSYARILQEIEE